MLQKFIIVFLPLSIQAVSDQAISNLFKVKDDKPGPEKMELLTKSILSSVALLSALLWIHYHYGGFKKEYLIIAISAQCIGGVYLYQQNRIKTALLFSVIVIGIALVGLAPHYVSWLLPVSIILFAFAVSYCNRFFPQNAGDVIAPGSIVLFVILIVAKRNLQPLALAATGVTIGILIQLVFVIGALVMIYIRTNKSVSEIKDDAANTITQPIKNAPPTFWLSKQEVFFSIRLAALLLISAYLNHVFKFKYAYWLPFTIVVLCNMSDETTRNKTLHRIVGTLLGCVGSYLLFLIALSSVVMMALILILNSLFVFYVRYNFMLASLSVTLFILLLIDHNTHVSNQVIVERFLLTFIAGVLVWSSSYISSRINVPAST